MTEQKELQGLPARELLRIDEVANYFQVTERTIRLWIAHGHLAAEKIVGTLRITKTSIANCRFNRDHKVKSQVIGISKKPIPAPVAERIDDPSVADLQTADLPTDDNVKVKKKAGRPKRL